MNAMPKTFIVGDHVRWNSEAGRVSGVIIKKLTHDTKLKGYTHHASREAPQYLIKSDKTDHVAVHKGTTLRLIPALAGKSSKTKKRRRPG
jgi:hypothetical protein